LEGLPIWRVAENRYVKLKGRVGVVANVERSVGAASDAAATERSEIMGEERRMLTDGG
jgi:hypothetical protein